MRAADFHACCRNDPGTLAKYKEAVFEPRPGASVARDAIAGEKGNR
jgi:hypothetical protein